MTDRIPENYQPYTPEQGRQDVSPLGFLTNGSSSSNVPNGVLAPTLENTSAVIPNGVTTPSGPGRGSSSNAGRLNNGSSSVRGMQNGVLLPDAGNSHSSSSSAVFASNAFDRQNRSSSSFFANFSSSPPYVPESLIPGRSQNAPSPDTRMTEADSPLRHIAGKSAKTSRMNSAEPSANARAFLLKYKDNIRCDLREGLVAPPDVLESLRQSILDPAHINQEQFLGLIEGQYQELEELWIALKGQLDAVEEIWEYSARRLDGIHLAVPADLLEPLVLFLKHSFEMLREWRRAYSRHNRYYRNVPDDDDVLVDQSFLNPDAW